MLDDVLHHCQVVSEQRNGSVDVESHQELHCLLIVGGLSRNLHGHLWCQLLHILRRFINKFVVHWPLVTAGHTRTGEVIVGSCSLASVLQWSRVEIKSIVNVNFTACLDSSYNTNNLMILKTNSHSVGIAAVVEEGHGGEDGAPHWNDVELSDVVVLQDALRHL